MDTAADPSCCVSQRRLVRQMRWRLPALLIPVLVGQPSAAQDARDEIERWVPAVGVFFDALGQKMEGDVTSSEVMGPPLSGVADNGLPWEGCDQFAETGVQDGPVPPPVDNDDPFYRPRQDGGGNPLLCQTDWPAPLPLPVTFPDSGSDTSAEPMVGGTFELMTPALADGFLRPRLFAHVDVAGAFTFDRNLAGEGKPGAFSAPDNAGRNAEEASIAGQGARVNATGGGLVVSAGFGVAFTADVFGRRLRIKPSVEYIRREIEIEGTVRRVVKLVEPEPAFPRRPAPPLPNPNRSQGAEFPLDFRPIDLRASDDLVHHGVGAGLELEADMQKAGPILMSVYLNGRGYHFPGDLEETLGASNEFGESVTFRWDFEPWAWRGGVGLRFRWVPD